MRIVKTNLIDKGNISLTHIWKSVSFGLEEAIQLIHWPEGSSSFKLNPTKKGNGVTSLKPDSNCMGEYGWQSEKGILPGIGPVDYLLSISNKKFVMEWETGNIASSYRAMTKINHALLKGYITGAILVIPTKQMARFLTDRTSSFEELKNKAILDVWSIEYDGLDDTIELLPKARTGRNSRCQPIPSYPIFSTPPHSSPLN